LIQSIEALSTAHFELAGRLLDRRRRVVSQPSGKEKPRPKPGFENAFALSHVPAPAQGGKAGDDGLATIIRRKF
jgi:hypothetical protein